MKKLSYLEIGIQTLEALNKPATRQEIWTYIEQHELYKKLKSFDETIGKDSIGKTPIMSLSANLYTEAKKDGGKIYTLGSQPKYFCLNKWPKQDANKLIEIEENYKGIDEELKETKYCERDLHQLLCAYLKGNQISSRTIYHEESNKKQRGADKWLYPDMVAVKFDYDNYDNDDLLNFIKRFDRLPLKIFSFEIKIQLDYGNYKKSFFQAVSNSSWANEGYLVALNIDKDEEFIRDLQKLSSSFGIGIIQLDARNVLQSQILVPARYKENIDYATADDLAEKNRRFSNFLKTIVDYDPKNPDRFAKEFDTELTDEELKKHIEDKKIK